MPKFILPTRITKRPLRLFIQDSSKTDGSGLTGLVFNSAGLTACWIRLGLSSTVTVPLVTMTLGTWVSGGFVEVDATNMPGLYEFGAPDDMLGPTGGDEGEAVVLMLKGAADMVPVVSEIQLETSWDEIGTRQIITDFSPTVTSFDTGLSSSVNDFHNGSLLIFTSGVNQGINRLIIDYDGGASRKITLAPPLETAPATDDEFIIIALGAYTIESLAEGSFSVKQILRFVAAALAGEVSGAGTSSIVFKSAKDNTKTRITATTDAVGNRTSITINVTDL